MFHSSWLGHHFSTTKPVIFPKWSSPHPVEDAPAEKTKKNLRVPAGTSVSPLQKITLSSNGGSELIPPYLLLFREM